VISSLEGAINRLDEIDLPIEQSRARQQAVAWVAQSISIGAARVSCRFLTPSQQAVPCWLSIAANGTIPATAC
jgi:hypothetical protein